MMINITNVISNQHIIQIGTEIAAIVIFLIIINQIEKIQDVDCSLNSNVIVRGYQNHATEKSIDEKRESIVGDKNYSKKRCSSACAKLLSEIVFVENIKSVVATNFSVEVCVFMNNNILIVI